MKKEGIFFSLDALIALLVIFLIVLISIPLFTQFKSNSKIEQDIITSLSSIKVSEYSNSDIQDLISQGKIKDLNKKLIEELGELYVTNKTLAKSIADDFLSKIDTKENLGIWFDNKLLTSKNSSPIEQAYQVSTARQILSGIMDGENITGFSARAYLSSSSQIKYTYFGGYVGDGNLTFKIEYSGNISSAEIELVINNDFELEVNGISQGIFQKSSSDKTPAKYNISTANFQPGENLIELKGESLYVAGGFLRISYLSDVEYKQPEKYDFPGITGIVNLYDGIYLPSKPSSINISLHIDTNGSNIFLNIGNKTVYNNFTQGPSTITISNSTLGSILNYDQLSKKTTPIRLGIENSSYVINSSGNADAISVTDLSGSMINQCDGSGFSFIFCCFSGVCQEQSTCNSCGGTWEPRISAAKDANYAFVDLVLNNTGNRAGLVGYNREAYSYDYHTLSTDKNSLDSKITSWVADGPTCICCGINSAINEFNLNSDESKFKSIILMSDGTPNVQCPEQGTGSPTQDAIQSACEAFNNYNITVYSIGFGTSTDETTLQSIASCGNGSYYYSGTENLTDIYNQITQEIVQASYNYQTVSINGDYSSKLFSDSFISFDYPQIENNFGLILTNEISFENATTGNFDIPEGSTLLNAFVTSYSGPKWTKIINLNDINFFSLDKFSNNYINLGDPFANFIDNSLINVNSTNKIDLLLGSTANQTEEGSNSNSIIYTISKNITSFSPISSNNLGCFWSITFEDDTTNTINIPLNYSGIETCNYQPGNIIYDQNDAAQYAAYSLLKQLDLNNNDKIDIILNSKDISIGISEVTGIPFPWSTEIQVRKWF